MQLVKSSSKMRPADIVLILSISSGSSLNVQRSAYTCNNTTMGSGSPSPVGSRLWRPAAQRNVRNSWASIKSQCAVWASASSKALTAATSLVNAHLSYRYLNSSDLGVLSNMEGICEKAQAKLLHQQEILLEELLENYIKLGLCVMDMLKAASCTRTYVKGSPTANLLEFSNDKTLDNDTGDGGGVAVFSTFSLQTFEMLAGELVSMYQSELTIKSLVVGQLHRITCPSSGFTTENNLKQTLSIPSETSPCIFDTDKTIKDLESDCSSATEIKREILQVYLTAWLVEARIKKLRIEEIFAMVSEEMQISL